MAPLALWETDVEFLDIWSRAGSKTLIDPVRGYVLRRLAQDAWHHLTECDHVGPTDHALEVGVYRGGSLRIIAESIPLVRVYGFDTFSGMPDTDPALDVHRAGDFAAAMVEVQADLNDLRNVTLVSGRYPASDPAELAASQIVFAHVDCDIYESVRDSFEFIFPRLIPGCAIVFDDYGFTSCPGAKRAVDEVACELGRTPIYLPTGQALVLK